MVRDQILAECIQLLDTLRSRNSHANIKTIKCEIIESTAKTPGCLQRSVQGSIIQQQFLLLFFVETAKDICVLSVIQVTLQGALITL